MTLLLIYLFLALSISFLCSIVEAVLLSTPMSYLKVRAEQGNKNALKFLKYKTDIDKPISAILSLNTIAHTVGAAGVGAQAMIVFGSEYFAIVSAILTILILVLTEIIPKTLGSNFNKPLMSFSAIIISLMIFLTYPLIYLLSFISRSFGKGEFTHTTSREEIAALVNIGSLEGVFADKENKIIQNLIKLKNVKVSEIMTPRVVLVVANEEMELASFLKNKDFLHFSRIPVYKDNPDNITGYIFREAVFEKLAEDRFDLKLKNIKHEILTMPVSTTLLNAWEKLLNKVEYITLIVDEYGVVDGIVTLEDIVETLLGFEIVDEKDKIPDMQKYAEERWKMKQKKYKLLDEKI